MRSKNPFASRLAYSIPIEYDLAGQPQFASQLTAPVAYYVPTEQTVPRRREVKSRFASLGVYTRSRATNSWQKRKKADHLARPDAGQVLQPVKHDLAPQAMALDIEQPGGVRLVAIRDS
jgi:hypothetical protein